MAIMGDIYEFHLNRSPPGVARMNEICVFRLRHTPHSGI